MTLPLTAVETATTPGRPACAARLAMFFQAVSHTEHTCALETLVAGVELTNYGIDTQRGSVVSRRDLSEDEALWVRYLKIENWLLAIGSRLLVPNEAAGHWVGLAWPKGGPWACWS